MPDSRKQAQERFGDGYRRKVKRDDIDPEPVELIAKSIIVISDAMSKFDKLITRKGLVALIHEALPRGSKINNADINAVLFIPKKVGRA